MMFYINDVLVVKTQFESWYGNSLGFIVENKQKIAFDDLLVTMENK